MAWLGGNGSWPSMRNGLAVCGIHYNVISAGYGSSVPGSGQCEANRLTGGWLSARRGSVCRNQLNNLTGQPAFSWPV